MDNRRGYSRDHRGRDDYDDRGRQQGGDFGGGRWQEEQYSRDFRQQGSHAGDRQQGAFGEREEWQGGDEYGSSRRDPGMGAGRYGSAAAGAWQTGSRSGYGSRDEWQNTGSFPQSSGLSGADRDYGADRGYRGQAGPGRWSSGRPYGGGERGYAEGGRDFWDKASDEVSSWFGDRDAERRREMDQHRGRGPKNYSRSDDRIRDDVNDRLTDDGWVDASDIDVTVKSREVTLSGHVDSRMAKRRAEDIAESVSGVSHVQNNLRVRQAQASSTASGMSEASGSQSGFGSSTKGSGTF